MYFLFSRLFLMVTTATNKTLFIDAMAFTSNLLGPQQLPNNTASPLASTLDNVSSTNLTDFPEAVMNAGSKDGVTFTAGSPVTWNGAYQTLTCHAVYPTTTIQWGAECEPRGCLFQSIKITDQQYKMRFVGDYSWNNSGASCRVYDVPYISNTYYIPILVRDPPTLEIAPSTVDVYLQHIVEPVVLRCRIKDNPYVKVSSLRWSARGSDGSAISNLTFNVTYDISETRLRLYRSDIEVVRRVRCEGAVGVEAPYLRFAAVVDIHAHASPRLRVTPGDRVFTIGRQVTLWCQTDDVVIGGLRWSISCNACRWDTDKSTNRTSLEGARTSLTFMASSAWNGVPVGCHIANHVNLAVYLTVVVKRLPTLSLDPAALDVYDDHTSTVRCLARYTPASGEIEPPTYPTDIRLFVKLNGDETQAELVELSYNVRVDQNGFLLSFTPTPAWHRRKISCHLWTCDSLEIAETARTVVVHVYSPPVITIVPSSLSLGLGSNATLLCSADGYIIGGLQWTVDCADCSYRSESDYISATNARLRLLFIVTTSWDGAKVGCGVQSTAGMPSVSAAVEVLGIKSIIAVQWIWLSLGLTGIVILLVTAALRRRAQMERTRRRTLTKSSSGRHGTSSSAHVDGTGEPVMATTYASAVNTEQTGRPGPTVTEICTDA